MDDSLTASGIVVALVAFGFPAFMLMVARALGSRRPDEVKNSVFESGIRPEVDARRRFSVKFHAVARLVLVLQAALTLIIPIALVFRGQASASLWAALALFFLPLTVGLVFAYRGGALRWE